MKERTLFNMDETRKRNTKYVRSKSKTGELTVHVNADTTALIKEYCKMHSVNCKQFVNDVLTEKMQELEQNKYDGLTKEELINLLKERDRNND